MAGSQTLRFDILADSSSANRAFKQTADGAALAARGAKQLADSLGIQSKSAEVSARATVSLAKSDDILRDAELALAGVTDEATNKIQAQGRAAEDAAVKTRLAGGAAKSAGSGFGLLASPMGVAVAAGVALSPVLLTVGAGLGGLGVAAYEASKNTKAMATILGPLKSEVHQFSDSLQPEVLHLFGQGASLAAGALKDIQPIAAQTGKALSGVLSEVDAEFKSQNWTQFFQFMAAEAGPDVKQLGGLVVDLTNDLPPLLEALQPVASGFLTLADDAAKAAGAVEAFGAPVSANAQTVAKANQANKGFFGELAGYLDKLKLWQSEGLGVKQANDAAAKSTRDLGTATGTAGAQASHVAPVLTTLGTANQFVQKNADAASTAVGKLDSAWSAFLGMSTNLMTAQLGVRDTLGQLATQAKAAGASFTGTNAASRTLQETFENNLVPSTENVIGGMLKAHATTGQLASVLSTDLKPAVDAGALSNRALRQQIYDMAVQAGYTGPNQLKSLQGWIDKNAGSAKTAADKVAGLSANLAKLPSGEKINIGVYLSGSGEIKSSVSGLSGMGAAHLFLNAASGGRISGAGGPTSDNIHVMASPGEWVINAASAGRLQQDFGPGIMPAINSYATGGQVTDQVARATGFAAGRGSQFASLEGEMFARSAAAAFSKAVAAAAARVPTVATAGSSGGIIATMMRNMAAAREWGGAQWNALYALENREAGFSMTARNPSSGAYGLAQFINGPSEYAAYGGNATTATGQITGMYNYIAQRYGTPANAWAHEVNYGWYGNGLNAVVSKPTLIGVGERGPEHVQVTPVIPGRGGGSGNVTIVLQNHGMIGSEAELKRWLLEANRELVRVKGGGNTQTAFGRQ